MDSSLDTGPLPPPTPSLPRRGKSFRRIFSIFTREYLHISRDPRSFLISCLLPLFTLFLTAYTLTSKVKPIALAAFDGDGTAESRAFLRTMEDLPHFDLRMAVNSKEGKDWLKSGEVKGFLAIPANFTYQLAKGENADVQMQIDAADPLSTRLYLASLEALGSSLPRALQERAGLESEEDEVDSASFQNLFNPSLDHFSFVIPALIGCILMSIFPFLSAVSIVREREEGSLDRMLASPASSGEILLGKLLAYFFLALLQLILLAIFGVLWFDIPFRGSPAEFLLAGAAFCLWSVSFGLLISTFAKNQMTALSASVTLTLLPAFIFSGLYFPIRSMPWAVRWVGYLVPTPYFSEISRAVFLKGSPLLQWWPYLLALTLLAAVTLAWTRRRFHQSVRGPA